MLPVVIPVGIFSFLAGAALTTSRRGLSMLPPSPLPGVPLAAWRKFVSVMVVAPRETASPRGRLGYFGLDARHLADVGLMREPRKTQVGGESGVWAGQWVPPLTTESFLRSPAAQYEAFSRSVRRLAPRVAPMVGIPIDGQRASLSGLLAAGHLAGLAGIASWARDPAARQKFRATTANFRRANDIF